MHSFNSFSDTLGLAELYKTQWPGDKTHPVHVTNDDMERYLTSTGQDMGLGDFNRKDLIAATFMKQNDKGYLAGVIFEPLVCEQALLGVGKRELEGKRYFSLPIPMTPRELARTLVSPRLFTFASSMIN